MNMSTENEHVGQAKVAAPEEPPIVPIKLRQGKNDEPSRASTVGYGKLWKVMEGSEFKKR